MTVRQHTSVAMARHVSTFSTATPVSVGQGGAERCAHRRSMSACRSRAQTEASVPTHSMASRASAHRTLVAPPVRRTSTSV